MRIGIFDPYLDSLGGGENYILNIASNLSTLNEVSMLWDGENFLPKAGQRFDLNLSKIKLSENIFSIHKSFLKKLNLTRDYDSIFYLSDGSLPIVLSKRLFVHFQFPVNWVNGKSFLNQIKIKRINKVICNSYYTKKFIDKTFNINSVVLYPPVLVNKEDVKNFKKEKIILTVGRYQENASGGTYKKHEILIDIFKNFIKDREAKDFKMIIVATFPREENYKKLLNLTCGLPIQIFKDLNAKELTSIYAKSMIYWHASGFNENLEKNPHLAEHFGMTTVEAMSYGCVPVAINAGGQKEIVDDSRNGYLWNSTNECLLKTLDLIKNKRLFKNFSKFAFEKSKLFSREKFVENLNLIIK